MGLVAFILGSNLNNRGLIIKTAIEQMIDTIGPVVNLSSPYETPPWGYESSNPFINQAVILETDLEPQVVMNKCLEIEKLMGRKRNSPHYEDRTIDIDIALWKNKEILSQTLTIPHPLICDRQFVLIPLNEIASKWEIKLPNKKPTTVSQALNDLIKKEGQITIKQV